MDEELESMEGPTGPSPARWAVLVVIVLVNLVLALFRSTMPTGYTLGVATAPLVWGLLVASVVRLVRGRKLDAFASAFFWVTLVFTCLALVKAVLP